MRKQNRKPTPWQSALLATSGLGAIFVATNTLWQAGHPQWGFLLAFCAVWALISISWSNVDYTEESGLILADIVDRNIQHLHDRIEELEREIALLKERHAGFAEIADDSYGKKRLP